MEKRKVTMLNVTTIFDEKGRPVQAKHEAVDYVPVDLLEAYCRDAATRWASVTVGTKNDHGPGGTEGDTFYPEHLDHPLAGQTVKAGD